MRIAFLIVFFLVSLNSFSETRYIHVLVALCVNLHQGIVPVPMSIGDGQNPRTNLYWGCGYGVKTFFKKQQDWQLVKTVKSPSKEILERLVFKHKTSSVYLVADAYDGATIKQTVIDFLDYSAGKKQQTLKVDSLTLNMGGNADLICYVGHDGLMDFSLESYPTHADSKKRDVIILACASKAYFKEPIKQAGANPLLWTSNLMCPEAYTLDAAIDAWILNETAAQIREKAAQAYNKYQKCGIKGALNLLVTGF